MTAYLLKTKTGFELRLCARPCNGAELQASEMIIVSGKREANSICKARSATPYNW